MSEAKTVQQQFEAWHRNTLRVLQGTGQVSAARKMIDHKDLMQVVWEESRAEAVVQFPMRTPYVEYPVDVEGGEFNYIRYLDDLKKNITALGLGIEVST
ncbi:hypothetical protein ACF8EA_08170 [Pseudomonas sp. YQ_5]|uniref:hypothetical protein n=1 Tax=Pseudomonas sp. YQ_5 TaxID=3367229 RepID=UPI00370C4B8D